LRLAVFTNQFPGRVSTFFARDMRGLLEAGVDVDVFAIYPHEPELWHYVPAILNEREFPREKVHHPSLAQSLRYARPWLLGKLGTFLQDTAAISVSAARFGVRPLVKTLYVFLEAWVWAQQYSTRYDHILAYWGNYAATCAYIFHRLIDRPIPFSMFLHAGLDLFRDQVYLPQKLLYSDNIIVVCNFNKRFLREKYPDVYRAIEHKIHLHHLGLNFDEFQYQPDNKSSQKVLAVGRFDRKRGFDYLLRAVYELKHRGINIDVELAGDGEANDTLRALAHELQILERVKFLGWLPSHEVQTAMRRATILVHPPLHLGDAVPTVIKEAMALGTPVIASSTGGIPELLDSGRCGMLVPPKDVKALANAIEMLLGDDPVRHQYAAAARRYAEENFDLWQNGRRLADMLCSTKRLIKPVRSHG
jgi:colanic acid/amylovoran biosynthesis glycosyltransferase